MRVVTRGHRSLRGAESVVKAIARYGVMAKRVRSIEHELDDARQLLASVRRSTERIASLRNRVELVRIALGGLAVQMAADEVFGAGRS